jgi:hypothetical protein
MAMMQRQKQRRAQAKKESCEGANQQSSNEGADSQTSGNEAAQTSGEETGSQTSGDADRLAEIDADPDFQEACKKADAGGAEEEEQGSGGEEAPDKLKIGGDQPADKPNNKKQDELTGIGSKIAVGRFVTKAKEIQATWTELPKESRAKELGGAANEELDAVGVPKTEIQPQKLDKNIDGRFDSPAWALILNQLTFEANSIDDAKASEVADTVYHEARHAEQSHLMARLQLQQGKSPGEVKNELEIPSRIVEDAAQKPIDGAEKKLASSLVAGTQGAAKGAHKQVFKDYYRKLADTRAARDRFKALRDGKAPADQIQQAEAEMWEKFRDFKETVAAYHQLVDEADAHRVGGAVKKAYK